MVTTQQLRGNIKMVDVKIVPEAKPFWKSKTFQLAALTTLAGVITSIAGSLEAGVPITLMSVLMIIMRTITNTAVSGSEANKE